MGRTRSGNARTAPMHMRTTPQFARYVDSVCEEEGINRSTIMRESLALLLELRRDFLAAAQAADLPLAVFVKRAVKDHVDRSTP